MYDDKGKSKKGKKKRKRRKECISYTSTHTRTLCVVVWKKEDRLPKISFSVEKAKKASWFWGFRGVVFGCPTAGFGAESCSLFLSKRDFIVLASWSL